MRNIDDSREREIKEQLKELLPRLGRNALGYTRSHQEIGDLVQETCKQVLSKWTQFRGDGRFDSWAMQIMRNVWREKKRKEKQRGDEELPDPDQVATAGFEGDIVAKDMLAAMGKLLSSDDFLLLIKISVYGCTPSDIADELNMPYGTVSAKICRLRRALRKAGWSIEGPPT